MSDLYPTLPLTGTVLLLIDAPRLSQDEVLKTLYGAEATPCWWWLYDDTVLSEHREASPILVQPAQGGTFLREAIERWGRDGLLALTTRDPGDCLQRLRHHLLGRLPGGGHSVVRYYDPYTLQVLRHFAPEELTRLMAATGDWCWSLPDFDGRVCWQYQPMPCEAPPQSIGQQSPALSEAFQQALSWVAHYPRIQSWALKRGRTELPEERLPSLVVTMMDRLMEQQGQPDTRQQARDGSLAQCLDHILNTVSLQGKERHHAGSQ